MKKTLSIFILSFLSLSHIFAQDSLLPNEGKMKTTVLILCAILLGVFVFLFILERRINKLENQIKDES